MQQAQWVKLVVLSWFGGVVGMKFSLKQFAPYLLSSGADFWFSTDFSFSRIYTCMNSIHIVANNITYPVTCLRGISLLLMCVALSVLFSMGYPIMTPHLAIVSFSIHHLLCKLGNVLLLTLSLSLGCCLYSLVGLPLDTTAECFFEIDFWNPTWPAHVLLGCCFFLFSSLPKDLIAARQLPTENIDRCLIGKDNGRKKRYVSVG